MSFSNTQEAYRNPKLIDKLIAQITFEELVENNNVACSYEQNKQFENEYVMNYFDDDYDDGLPDSSSPRPVRR